MTRHTYDKEITALLVIDPYNDFISEGGKIWDRIRAVAEANGRVPHKALARLRASRRAMGPRPPGTTTWPREARCTDPEAMPEMEARDPA